MCHRFPTSQGALAVAIALVSLAAVSVKGQAPAAKTTKLWTPPRTPNGQPDLQGVWNYSAGTPLERPAAFAGKLTLTDDELAQAEKRILERNSRDRRDGSGTNADVNRDHNEFWDDPHDQANVVNHRSTGWTRSAADAGSAEERGGPRRGEARTRSSRLMGGSDLADALYLVSDRGPTHACSRGKGSAAREHVEFSDSADS
jgi:hypothetical protein